MRDMWSESLVGSFFSSAERPLWLHFKTCITLLYFFPPEHLSGADLPEAGFTVLLENKHASGRGDKVPDAQHARRGKYSLPLNVCLIWKITFWLNFRFDALGRLFFFFFFAVGSCGCVLITHLRCLRFGICMRLFISCLSWVVGSHWFSPGCTSVQRENKRVKFGILSLTDNPQRTMHGEKKKPTAEDWRPNFLDGPKETWGRWFMQTKGERRCLFCCT